MIPVDFCKKPPIINFTTDDTTTRFELFSKIKTNYLYLTESMQTYWVHMLDEYSEERDTPHLDDFEFCPECFFQYLNELPLGEAIESDYFMWK